jgi:hypothetical protein
LDGTVPETCEFIVTVVEIPELYFVIVEQFEELFLGLVPFAERRGLSVF